MSLAGINILITRPAAQAEPLAKMLAREGAKPVLFPVFEIEPASKRSLTGLTPLRQLPHYHLAIFTSVNAVQYAVGYLKPQRLSFPPDLALAAVGARTAQELKTASQRPVLHPQDQFDSEALLALDSLRNVRGKRVLIVRGEGGRELLADVLRTRGAKVEYAEVYRRVLPKSRLTLLPDDNPGVMHAIVMSSEEGLANLRALIEPGSLIQLLGTPLVVSSRRVQEKARFMGFSSDIIVASDATDDNLVEALRAHPRFHRKNAS